MAEGSLLITPPGNRSRNKIIILIIVMKKPNFLIFFTDQQRWDTSKLHGNTEDLTPNYDFMARSGTHFLMLLQINLFVVLLDQLCKLDYIQQLLVVLGIKYH